MKSTVCKKANELIRKGCNRSEAFRRAWAIVKSMPQEVKASELKAGNTIHIEWGEHNNHVTCTVEEITFKDLFYGKYYSVKAVAANGLKVDFVAKPEDKIEIVA